MLKKSVYHERITAQNSLIKGQFGTAIDLGTFFLHDHIKNTEVKIARVLQKLDYKVLLIQENIDIKALQF